MRIDLNYGSQATPESNRSNSPSPAAAASSTSAASEASLGGDQAQLSGAHAEVQTLAAQAAQLPEVREERVHALRQALESGQYQTSTGLVAGALVDHLIAARAA